MTHIRTLIADDEPEERARLARLLAKDPEIELVAECRNGQETMEAVRKHGPDLLFLNVLMPQVNGSDVLHQLSRNGIVERMPFVVFVTAHDQCTLKAFDLKAVDFLLKPYDDERFHASLAKARKWIEQRMNSMRTGGLMDPVREHMRSGSGYTEVFVIRDKGRENTVPVDEIVFLRAEGNYLHLQLREKHHLHRMTMNAVETKLDPLRFLRIHRSFIVNKAHVRSSRYSGNNEFIFTMANNERIISGRSYKESIAKALQERSV